ncbi:MAG: hypothetical protein JKX97_00475, partial [Candidatus Lindowbacteria bacterium]|nr:hypothetical protein [Candidatus Lindowbacteria bacterium]
MSESEISSLGPDYQIPLGADVPDVDMFKDNAHAAEALAGAVANADDASDASDALVGKHAPGARRGAIRVDDDDDNGSEDSVGGVSDAGGVAPMDEDEAPPTASIGMDKKHNRDDSSQSGDEMVTETPRVAPDTKSSNPPTPGQLVPVPLASGVTLDPVPAGADAMDPILIDSDGSVVSAPHPAEAPRQMDIDLDEIDDDDEKTVPEVDSILGDKQGNRLSTDEVALNEFKDTVGTYYDGMAQVIIDWERCLAM